MYFPRSVTIHLRQHGRVNSTACWVNRKANSRTLAIEENHGNCVVCENSREISWQVSRER